MDKFKLQVTITAQVLCTTSFSLALLRTAKFQSAVSMKWYYCVKTIVQSTQIDKYLYKHWVPILHPPATEIALNVYLKTSKHGSSHWKAHLPHQYLDHLSKLLLRVILRMQGSSIRRTDMVLSDVHKGVKFTVPDHLFIFLWDSHLCSSPNWKEIAKKIDGNGYMVNCLSTSPPFKTHIFLAFPNPRGCTQSGGTCRTIMHGTGAIQIPTRRVGGPTYDFVLACTPWSPKNSGPLMQPLDLFISNISFSRDFSISSGGGQPSLVTVY